VRLFLKSKLRVFLFLAAGLVSACARSSPELPPDLSDVTDADKAALVSQISPKIQNMDCSQIFKKMRDMAEQDKKLERAIHANRKNNQVAGYFGGLFILPLIAVETNDAEKNKLDLNQKRRDELILAYQHKKCGGQKVQFQTKQ